LSSSLDLIGNYTLNIYNTNSLYILKSLNIKTTTISPELDENGILSVCENTPISKELIVYGNIPIMVSNYCFLGKTNHCYPDCGQNCTKISKYYLKDRLGYDFRIVPDNLQTITTIYNSKILSIPSSDIPTDSLLISILDENIAEINTIITTVKSGNTMSGTEYTYGNFNKLV